MNAALDAEYSLCVLKSKSSRVSPRELLRVLHQAWGYDMTATIAKSSEKTPGDHGDPEIGRQEKAFFDALTEGQQRAYKAVQELVYQFYNTNESWEGIDAWEIGKPIDEWKQAVFYDIATHPQKAFMLGQMLASEALKTPMHRPLMPTDSRAIRFLEATTFNEIDAKFDALKGDLRRALIDGMVNGTGPREIARKLANEMKDYNQNWKSIAITETARAETVGRIREFIDAGYEYCIGSSAHDSRECYDCMRLIDGKILRVSDVEGVTNFGVKREDWKPCVPLHPNCVVEGQEVLTPYGRKAIELIRPGEYVLTHRSRFRRVLATASRHHSGAVFDVGGLRVTGNHPVLTPDGFRLASNLGEVADVLGVDAVAWQEIASHDAHDAPTESREDRLFGYIGRTLAFRPFMPSAAVNLDGELRINDSEVDVEFIDRILGHDIDAQALQALVQRFFEATHNSALLHCASTLTKRLDTMLTSASGIMGLPHLAFAHGGSHRSPLHDFGIGTSALLKTQTSKPSNKSMSRTANILAQLIHRLSGDVLGVPRANLGISRSRLAPAVRSERVVNSLFSGHVYDLQVDEDETFVTQGLSVHNCRCALLPYRPGDPTSKEIYGHKETP